MAPQSRADEQECPNTTWRLTMDQKSTSQRLAEAMARTRQQWQARHKAEGAVGPETPPVVSPPAFTIALSREAGANGAEIARVIGERLGWAVYDRELLQEVAGAMGLRAGLLESVDERRQSWVQECLEAFGAAPTVSAGGYVRHLLETLLSLAAHGECVIVGRGAAQVLPAATTLRVRIVGRLEDRIEVIRQRLGIAPKEAARWVEKTDAERVRFVKDHFHKDPTDPRQYDLVLNGSRFSVTACAELVIEALRQLRVQAPSKRPGVAAL
jgi:cytidylate kinase